MPTTTKSDLLLALDAARLQVSQGPEAGDAGALIMRAKGIVTIPAGLAANDILAICDLPPGCTPLPEHSHVTCDADPGTALVGDVGYTDAAAGGAKIDANGLADAIVLSAGGKVDFTSGTMPAAVHTPVRLDRVTRVNFIPSTVTAVTTGRKLSFSIAYAMPG